MSSPKHPAARDAVVAMRLPVALRDRLRAEAVANERSVSGQVRWLIEQALSHEHDGTPESGADSTQRQAAA